MGLHKWIVAYRNGFWPSYRRHFGLYHLYLRQYGCTQWCDPSAFRLLCQPSAYGATFGLNPSTRTVRFSAYTFDIFILGIYTTWHYRDCLIIVSVQDRVGNLGLLWLDTRSTALV